MTPDPAFRVLAAHLLKPYRLSAEERRQETESLAELLQGAAEEYLSESLEHRRV